MSSDRARDSYDPSRQYRSVVAQQGRVTLEADVNEAQRIAAENVRAETLDIVGPCGTPDDGYAVVGGQQPPAFSVNPGTMYVGGLRLTLANQVDYAQQKEWLDQKGDPLWIDPQTAGRATSELVYLFLREQEVSAVEDVPLREVALGGPDTGQRTRLIQRFVRLPVDADSCAAALKIAVQKWSDLGVAFDPRTMLLKSPATLQVQFVQQPVAESPCDPQVRGGYLGADNQLIRVQITGFDPKTNKGRFVWSYNNASFLYRVARAGEPQTLVLLSAPIDSYHTPRVGQAVEVLRGAVDLGSDNADDLESHNYVAAHCGFVTAPAQAYVPETRRLALQPPLPGDYFDSTGPLFLRLWEAEVTFTPGQPADLAGTGLQVVIDLNGKFGALTIGQFWFFAVRPSAPTHVYPQRYLDVPQPPEGPRMWVCPLATIGWIQGKFSLLADCREHFDDLVDLTKRESECCSIVVKPVDVDGGAGLKKMLDSLAGKKATLSLQPGLYELPQPLVLTKEHDGLTLEGCHDGVVLAAKAGAAANFAVGLVILSSVSDFTLRRLRLQLPLVQPAAPAAAPVAAPAATSIGLRVIQCANLRVEECLFSFILAPAASVQAAAIWAAGECPNLRFERNRFVLEGQSGSDKPERFLVGFAATPALPDPGTGGARKQPEFLPALLENTAIIGNEFAGLTLAVFVRGEFGRLRCENNFAHGCDGGFYFANTNLQILRESLLDAFRNRARSPADDAMFTTLLQTAQPSVLSAMHDFALGAPLPAQPAAPFTVKIGQRPDSATTQKARADAKLANAQFLATLKAAETAPVAGTAAGGTKPPTGAPARAAAPGPTTAPPIAPPPAVDFSIDQVREMTNSFLVTIAAEVALPQRVPELCFAGNEVETLPAAAPASGAVGSPPKLGLFVLLDPNLDPKSGASVMLASNNIRGACPQPIAMIWQPSTAVVTGNLVFNPIAGKENEFRSLVIQAKDSVLMNVSGNAFWGRFSINPAPATAGSGAGSWNVLNSVKF